MKSVLAVICFLYLVYPLPLIINVLLVFICYTPSSVLESKIIAVIQDFGPLATQLNVLFASFKHLLVIVFFFTAAKLHTFLHAVWSLLLTVFLFFHASGQHHAQSYSLSRSGRGRGRTEPLP